MAGGVTFANASIIMQGDAHLLTRKRIRDMATATNRDECLKVLAECGYLIDFDNDDALLDAARQQTLTTFQKLCPIWNMYGSRGSASARTFARLQSSLHLTYCPSPYSVRASSIPSAVCSTVLAADLLSRSSPL